MEYKARMAIAMRTALFHNGRMRPAELAARLGVTEETVRRWTRGDVEIRISGLAAICDALNVPADLFVRPPETEDEAAVLIWTHRGLRSKP